MGFSVVSQSGTVFTKYVFTNRHPAEDGIIEFIDGLKSSIPVEFIKFSPTEIINLEKKTPTEILKNNEILAFIRLGSYNESNSFGAEEISVVLKNNKTLKFLVWNGLGLKGLTQMAESLKGNNTLTFMDFGNNKMNLDGAKAIAAALKVNTSLTSLNLSRNEIGSQGAIVIARALIGSEIAKNLIDKNTVIGSETWGGNTTLTSLNLADNNIDSLGVIAIAAALKVNNTLTSLKLDENKIGVDGAKAIAEILKVNASLTSLSLENCSLDFEGIEEIATALNFNNSVTSINFNRNNINLAAAEAIAALLKGKSKLLSLSLENCNLDSAGIKKIIDAVKFNHTLTSIKLSGNTINLTEAEALASVLENNTRLTSISLENCKLSAVSVGVVMAALKFNTTLNSLNLDMNDAGPTGAKAILEALKFNRTLTSIQLSHNNLGLDGIKEIADFLKVNNTLTSISLAGNKVDLPAAKAIAEALKVNSTLTSINLAQMTMSKECLPVFEAALEQNYTLCECILNWNLKSETIKAIQARNKTLAKCFKLVEHFNKDAQIPEKESIDVALKELEELVASMYPIQKKEGKHWAETQKKHPTIATLYKMLNDMHKHNELTDMHLSQIESTATTLPKEPILLSADPILPTHPVLLEAAQKQLADELYSKIDFKEPSRETCSQILSLLINYLEERHETHWGEIANSMMHYLVKGTFQNPGQEIDYKILYPKEMKALIRESLAQITLMEALDKSPTNVQLLNDQRIFLQDENTSLSSLCALPVFKEQLEKIYPEFELFNTPKTILALGQVNQESSLGIASNPHGFLFHKDKQDAEVDATPKPTHTSKG